jgi:hypothetical protein
VEKLSESPYLLGDELEYTLMLADGSILRKKYLPHGFVGFRQCYLLNAAPLWKKANQQLQKDPFFFVDRISEEDRG